MKMITNSSKTNNYDIQCTIIS